MGWFGKNTPAPDSSQAADHARTQRKAGSREAARGARSARSGNISGTSVSVRGRHAAQSQGARRAF